MVVCSWHIAGIGSIADGADVVDPSTLGDLQDDVAAQLIEELLDRVVVEVHALVGAAYDLDHHAGVLEHQLVTDRGFSRYRLASIHVWKWNALKREWRCVAGSSI
jgi:hypothetical protein